MGNNVTPSLQHVTVVTLDDDWHKVFTSYHNYKVIIITKPRLFLQIISLKSKLYPKLNHTANLMTNLNL